VAWAFAAAKDLAGATPLSSCALRQVPEDANYRDTHGLVLALSGQREKAVEEFNYFIAHAQGIERFAHDSHPPSMDCSIAIWTGPLRCQPTLTAVPCRS
jgi:hypothetical protein